MTNQFIFKLSFLWFTTSFFLFATEPLLTIKSSRTILSDERHNLSLLNRLGGQSVKFLLTLAEIYDQYFCFVLDMCVIWLNRVPRYILEHTAYKTPRPLLLCVFIPSHSKNIGPITV
jgi:hypothetical protein